MIDAFIVRQIGVGMGCQRDQSLQVVADDFGRNILGHGLLGQSGDMLNIKAVLEPFEGLLDAPALVIQRAKQRRREGVGCQVGGQHAAVGGPLAGSVAIREISKI